MTFFSPLVAFDFSPKFLEKTGGGSLEKSLAMLDRILAVSSKCFRFIDLSSDGKLLIKEESNPISCVKIIAKVALGILLLPITIIALALKIILRIAFYNKESSSKEWVLLNDEEAAEIEEPEDLVRAFSQKELQSITPKLSKDLGERDLYLLKNLYAKIRYDFSSGRRKLEDLEKELDLEFLAKKTMDPEELMTLKWPILLPNKVIIFFIDKSPRTQTGCVAAELYIESKIKTYLPALQDWRGDKRQRKQVLEEKAFIQTGSWTYRSKANTEEHIQVVLENLKIKDLVLFS
ncbi:hypothetical protein [Chlamydiifrater phoenicopteri]|uniref:hypothetical protein n=1 Tax=Chlamydiifrater phoenicopteri TaxID=2681469 RepID=UPI001BCB18EE|nr:hypothetical protein [Chlamydiifrater phoenicopteri]